MWHHRRARTHPLVKFDLCSFSLSAVEGGCSRCDPPYPHPHHHYSLVHPNESLCYHHHHHSCHGNLAWGFGGMCGIAGDWLLGARCFPIKPVTGVCGSLPPHHHEERREREHCCDRLCYSVMVMFKQPVVLYSSHFTRLLFTPWWLHDNL